MSDKDLEMQTTLMILAILVGLLTVVGSVCLVIGGLWVLVPVCGYAGGTLAGEIIREATAAVVEVK
jgi:hypothetical protein